MNNRIIGSGSGESDRFADLLFPGPSREGPSNSPKTFGQGFNIMKTKLWILFLCLGLSATLLVIAQQAQATLGEFVGSVASDRKALLAVKHATTVRSGYSIHEFTAGGTAVREYVSPSGIVFGIAWNGLSHPDLAQLLGSYAGEYESTLRQMPRKPGPRRHEVLKTDRMIVEKWGHMRNLQGRAYAPALIPSGVNADEIR